jgi:hypothetical protein
MVDNFDVLQVSVYRPYSLSLTFSWKNDFVDQVDGLGWTNFLASAGVITGFRIGHCGHIIYERPDVMEANLHT